MEENKNNQQQQNQFGWASALKLQRVHTLTWH